MRTYIWKYLDRISNQWHNGGGLVIITGHNPDYDWKSYKSQMVENAEYKWEKEDWEKLRDDLPEPDFVYECESIAPKVLVFGDNGCC